jgi:hypothetical protein
VGDGQERARVMDYVQAFPCLAVCPRATSLVSVSKAG